MTVWADIPSYNPTYTFSPFPDKSPFGLGSKEKNKIASEAGWVNSWGDTWTHSQKPGQFLSANNLAQLLDRQQTAKGLMDPNGFNTGVDYMKMLEPYLQQSQTNSTDSRSRLTALMDNPNSISDSESYKFRLSQGQQALERSAAAKGTLDSGNTLAALLEYGQGAASAEYDKEFGRLTSLVNTDNQTAQTKNSLAGLVLNAGKAQADDYWNAQGLASKNALSSGYINSNIW